MADHNFNWSQDYPRVTVGAFIRNNKGEILLCQSPKWEDYWIVCGGHIDLGETIAEALIREVKEEVGLDVKFTRVISAGDFINNPHFHKPYHFVGLQCECIVKDDNQQPIIDNREITEVKWLSLLEAIDLPKIIDETKATITTMLNENK